MRRNGEIMPKSKSMYVCSDCGFETAKWYGKCPSCGQWNTLNEEIVSPVPSFGKQPVASVKNLSSLSLDQIGTDDEDRYKTGIAELDRVMGGGIVKGSLVLLGGDPGIGKSTIMLQICNYLGKTLKVLYVSGEESQRQIKIRAQRLGVDTPNLSVMAENDTQAICEYIRTAEPDIVIIDSIQTMCISDINSSPGSITQVRESTNMFLRTAKGLEIPIFIIGHVNKDGVIAGPKVMEHIVDTVLYFEGDKTLPYRILRAAKNRYGSTNEIGMFDMTGEGLTEIVNPSKLLLEGRPMGISGNCVACTMEGTRPILSEVQALATKSSLGTARRAASGFDYNRMNLLLAVLEKRAGFFFGGLDVYVNIVGGLQLDETACDLSVCLALVSSLLDRPLGDKTVAIGEVGLGGEVRNVTNLEQRLREAQRIGFTRAVVPKVGLRHLDAERFEGLELVGVNYLRGAISLLKG